MQLVKGTGSGNVSALLCKCTCIRLWKQRKYLVKFQSFCKIKSSYSQSLAEAGAVPVEIGKTVLCVKPSGCQLLLQNTCCLYCLSFCTKDHCGGLKLLFPKLQLLYDLIQCLFHRLGLFSREVLLFHRGAVTLKQIHV